MKFLAFYLSLFNSLSELHFFLFQFYKRMNVVRAAAVAVIVRRIELAHCLTPWLQLSVLQHNTFVLTVEFFSVKMHEKKDFLFCIISYIYHMHSYIKSYININTYHFDIRAQCCIVYRLGQ